MRSRRSGPAALARLAVRPRLLHLVTNRANTRRSPILWPRRAATCLSPRTHQCRFQRLHRRRRGVRRARRQGSSGEKYAAAVITLCSSGPVGRSREIYAALERPTGPLLQRRRVISGRGCCRFAVRSVRPHTAAKERRPDCGGYVNSSRPGNVSRPRDCVSPLPPRQAPPRANPKSHCRLP